MPQFLKYKRRAQRISPQKINTLLAYAASFMLTGIPPQVCESVLNDVIETIKLKIKI